MCADDFLLDEKFVFIILLGDIFYVRILGSVATACPQTRSYTTYRWVMGNVTTEGNQAGGS